MKQKSPAPEMGQEPVLKLGSLQNHTSNTENFKHPLSGKNRLLILELLERLADDAEFELEEDCTSMAYDRAQHDMRTEYAQCILDGDID